MNRRVVLSWSSGKDSAWALAALTADPQIELVALMTTFNEDADRVAMHAVRRQLAQAQAKAADLPLIEVDLPWPCSNEDYELRMADACQGLVDRGASHVAFGDLFLEDVRAYRERQLEGTGLAPMFPIWHPEGGTPALARRMVEAGLRAVLTCVDPKQLDPAFVGRTYDGAFLDALPDGVDPCGENGEFHTFCHAGPMFGSSIDVTVGEQVERGGFWFADLLPA